MKSGNTAGRNAGGKRRNRSKREENSRRESKAGNYLAEARQRAARDDRRTPGSARLKWSPPQLATAPVPAPLCPVCGKPVKDLAAALTDAASGSAAHFDCVRDGVSRGEALGEGDAVAYIGGGRFGIVHFERGGQRGFSIKKVIEYEKSETHSPWRSDIADHFSVT